LLFAGTALDLLEHSVDSSQYYLNRVTVSIVSLSAGNHNLKIKNLKLLNTSETIRDEEYSLVNRNILHMQMIKALFSTIHTRLLSKHLELKQIKHWYKAAPKKGVVSIHVNKHIKPQTDLDVASYVNAYFLFRPNIITENSITVIIHQHDVSLAYFIKGQIGYGKVKKNRNDTTFLLTHPLGLEKVNHWNTKYPFLSFWLARRIDARGSFHVDHNLIKNTTHPSRRIELRITHSNRDYLKLIIEIFPGTLVNDYVSYSKDKIVPLIQYFDRFPLQSTKHVIFLKWRKRYLHFHQAHPLIPTFKGVQYRSSTEKIIKKQEKLLTSIDTLTQKYS